MWVLLFLLSYVWFVAGWLDASTAIRTIPTKLFHLDCLPVVKMDEIAMVRVMTHPMTIRWMTVFIHDNTITDNEMCYDLIKLVFFHCTSERMCIHVYVYLCFLQQSSIPNKKYTSIKSISSGALKTFKGSEKTLCYSTTSHRIASYCMSYDATTTYVSVV